MENEELEEVTVTEEVKEDKKSKKDKKKDNEIEELKKKIAELEDKNIRVTADMVNTIRRKEEETVRIMKYANESIITELLVVLDNFERALVMDNENPDDEVSSFLRGMKMIYDNFKNILEKYEVKEIDALGKEFDPNYHQAVMQAEDPDKESNIVIEVMQKGYTYKDKVIRPSMVKVNK